MASSGAGLTPVHLGWLDVDSCTPLLFLPLYPLPWEKKRTEHSEKTMEWPSREEALSD